MIGSLDTIKPTICAIKWGRLSAPLNDGPSGPHWCRFCLEHRTWPTLEHVLPGRWRLCWATVLQPLSRWATTLRPVRLEILHYGHLLILEMILIIVSWTWHKHAA